MKHKLLLLYSWFIRILLYVFPDTPNIMRFRGFLYGLGMKSCGKNFQVSNDAILNSLETICVGQNVFVGNMSMLNGAKLDIIIGNNVLIGPLTSIHASNHSFKNGAFNHGASIDKGVKIGNGTWIGANCTILSGAELPDYSILGGNSSLTKAFHEKGCLYAGSPAIYKKTIITQQDDI